MIGDDQLSAAAVVTALLDDDIVLAQSLIADNQEPQALAWGASTLVAGLWQHFTQQMGTNPSEAWAKSLLAISKGSE